MIEIKLSQEDLHDCRRAGSLRWQLSRAAGITDQQKGPTKNNDKKYYDYIGIKGEMAVARLYDLEFDPYRGGIDDGIDMFYEGVTIDVKSTNHTNGRLVFKSKDAFKAQIGILAVEIEDDLMGVPGWIAREEFKEISVPFESKGAFGVTQDNLQSPESLWGKMNNWKNKK